MPFAYMPGSEAHKLLKKIARLLGAKVATDFYGVEVSGRRILYRHGLRWTQRTGAKRNEYDQIAWHKPFGSTEDHRKIDFVLLHAERPPLFFLFPAKEAAAFARAYPKKLNISAEPQLIRENRERIWRAKLSLEDLQRKLRA